MIATQIIVNQPLLLPGGDFQLPIKHVFAAASGAYNLEIIFTNGLNPLSEPPAHVHGELFSATTNLADAASEAFARELAMSANCKTTKLKVERSARTITHSDVYALNGANLIAWLNLGNLNSQCFFDLWVNEF